MMKQRDMGCEDIALGREVGGAEAVEARLMLGGEGQGEDQRRRVRRWLDLTRRVLPGMAVANTWPIRLDHCFMRVLLDNAIGTVWHRVVARPAIRNLTSAQLDCAIALGEAVVTDPSLLPILNRRSLDWRRRSPV